MTGNIYDTQLKQSSDAVWYRWLGKNEKGTKQKFRLGKSKQEAKRRLRLIIALFESQAEDAGIWRPADLKAAKQVAKGKLAKLPRYRINVGDDRWLEQSAESYGKRLAYVQRCGVGFEAEDNAIIDEAVAAVDQHQRLGRRLKVELLGTTSGAEPTGQTVGEAIDAYVLHVTNKYSVDRVLTPWGGTQIGQLGTWLKFMQAADSSLCSTDLADLSVEKSQQMVDVISSRPKTFLSGQQQRMATSSAKGTLKQVRNFFEWLDMSDHWEWQCPRQFGKLNYKVAELEAEEMLAQKLRREKWRISDAEIKTLIKYARPSERVLILLGLNCAFGAAEIGSLRLEFLQLGSSEIKGIRFKTGNETRHKLWPETVEALHWVLQRRLNIKKGAASENIVFLSEKSGQPIWKKTKNGNYSNGFASRWAGLLERIKKDVIEFPAYSFGKLRKTAATRMLELHDAETASMLLAHGTPTEDKILKAYVNIPWKKLYAAQDSYGETIRPLLEKLDSLEEPSKNYIGLTKPEQIVAEYQAGVAVKQIAESVGVSVMTVYRHLDKSGVRR